MPRAPAPARESPAAAAVFENLRQSLDDLLDSRLSPEGRRSLLADMKRTLAMARVGVEDLQAGVAATRKRLEAQLAELETVRRRKGLAEGINDVETVQVAERYEAQLAEKVQVLERKLEVQQAEADIAQRELDEMTAAIKQSALGGTVASGPDRVGASEREADAAANPDAALASEFDSLSRSQRRQQHEAAAEDRLAALKRRMGK